jgi:histidyl-tRNA synthetase
MALNTQPYKGARDFYPEDMRVRDYIFGRLSKTVKRFGYEEYDAPILEPLDLYRAKTGEEIINEQIYAFVDRGNRDVPPPPDRTPTVSRMVAARRQELSYPLRLFSIPNLWRYERPQRGRLREHWQLNVDIFGEENITAEHEVILIINQILRDFGAKPEMYEIRINNREFIKFLLLEHFGFNEVQAQSISKLIDRMHKIERPVFEAEVDALCSPEQKDNNLSDALIKLLHINSIAELPQAVRLHPAIIKVEELLGLLADSGITNAKFDISIMRELDYYTNIVFEVFDTNPENNRAMFGGGRYDGLVGLFGVEPVATVGFGMGDVTLQNFLESHKLLPELYTDIDVLVITVGDVYKKAQKLLKGLREMGLNVAVDASDRKLGSKIKSADKKGVRYALFVGETELEEDRYGLKDLKTGEEEKHSPERLVSIIKDFRR